MACKKLASHILLKGMRKTQKITLLQHVTCYLNVIVILSTWLNTLIYNDFNEALISLAYLVSRYLAGPKLTNPNLTNAKLQFGQ